jgi:hypothetical protein
MFEEDVLFVFRPFGEEGGVFVAEGLGCEVVAGEFGC